MIWFSGEDVIEIIIRLEFLRKISLKIYLILRSGAIVIAITIFLKFLTKIASIKTTNTTRKSDNLKYEIPIWSRLSRMSNQY